MQPLDSDLQKNVEWLQECFLPSADFYCKPVCIGGIQGVLCMFEGLSGLEKLWQMAAGAWSRLPENWSNADELLDYLLQDTVIPVDPSPVTDKATLAGMLCSGCTALMLQGSDRALTVSTQQQLGRSVAEPTGEGNLHGAHEGFVEHLRTNISMVRRLIRAPGLCCQIMPMGRSTGTEVALLYHRDKCPPKLLRTLQSRLKQTDMDMILDGGYLVPFLVGGPFSLFASVGFTEKPDTAVAKLCEGKVIILVGGSPFAVIFPYFFAEHFQTMDDYAQRPYFTCFIRLLRYAAFGLSVLLPGMFLAVADFTPELLPGTLLYQIASAQATTPFSLFCETFLVNLLLEIIREAGLRLPKSVGHAVSLVSALIVGDAAVQIGLLGTPVLVACALSALCSYVVPALYEQGIILRLSFILTGGLMGPVGIALLSCFCLADLCRLTQLGLPYLAPFLPGSPGAWQDGFLRTSWRKLTGKRPFTVRDYFTQKPFRRGADDTTEV